MSEIQSDFGHPLARKTEGNMLPPTRGPVRITIEGEDMDGRPYSATIHQANLSVPSGGAKLVTVEPLHRGGVLLELATEPDDQYGELRFQMLPDGPSGVVCTIRTEVPE